ncbi:NEDD4-binding protein 2-like 2 [Cynoglossus semilaevis]|uniref:NEDD4 binding protein 2-like 2 n=1 Tax=Cynoglossus semilaevis TaxID=244447 RepID=A0A3P8VSL2_CYNSE|nr:NEDD4-binding protein 2-like 2 [Cynoglossus semilaevis]
MSQSGSPYLSPPVAQTPCVGENTKNSEDGLLNITDVIGKDQTGPDSNDRDRVMKEVGLTSAAFIGPSFPPPPATAKSDFENELSEFYKELETTDGGTGARVNTGTQKHVAQKTTNVEWEFAETDGYWKNSGQKCPSWPHWYQNEPYHLKKLRPNQTPMSHQPQIPYQQVLKAPAGLGPHGPPFHYPPPPYAFHINPQTQASPHVNPTWSAPNMSSHYLQNAHTQRFHSPHEHNLHRGHPYENYPQNLNRGVRGYEYRNYTDDGNVDWRRNKEGEFPQFDKDHVWRQERVSQNEQNERHCQPRENTHPQSSTLILILMRGLPGSGKTTLARELVSTGPNGLILSTDDYFAQGKDYHYDPGLLGAAHDWNHRRAKDAMDDRRSPIIIDNTNIEAWEMKPYVKIALEKGYRVDFCEPDTRWKFDPCELGKRNKHGVHQEKIAKMRKRFAFPVSIDIVMSSVDPPHVTQRHRSNQR